MVEAIDCCQRVHFVSVPKLLHDLSNRTGGEVAVSLAYSHDVNKLLGVWTLVSDSVVEHFVAVIQLLNFSIIQELLPVIGPALAQLVPDSWAWLAIRVLETGDVHLTVPAHVDI